MVKQRSFRFLVAALIYALLVGFVWASSAPPKMALMTPTSVLKRTPTSIAIQPTVPPAGTQPGEIISSRTPIDPEGLPTTGSPARLPADIPRGAAVIGRSTALPARATIVSQVYGTSSQGRPLWRYQFGDGPVHIVFIGGIHGGYEWNTIRLAYQAIDYFTRNPQRVPTLITLHIIPSANPDGQFRVTGKEGRFSPLDVEPDNFRGRFNGNDVDLNRNWDCNWMEVAFWRDRVIDPGEHPFSEPESAALRDFLIERRPIAVIFWHSAANGVFAAGCPDLYQPSFNLAAIYGLAAGYPVYESFDAYQVTGDASDWLSLYEIPASSVELVDHQDTEWSRNLKGMLAVLTQYQRIKGNRIEETLDK